MGRHATLGCFCLVPQGANLISGDLVPDLPETREGRTLMDAMTQEAAAPSPAVTTVEARPEYSQEYSQGHLEEMASRELLDEYAD